jgi:dipeptidyl aminopeptidase/acylaminoacyl peptidase
MAADLFVRVRAVGTGPTPVFQQLTFRQGPILRARFVDHAKSVAYTARFEGLPQTSYLLTPATGEVRDLKLPPSSAVVAVSSQGELAVRMLDGSLARMPLNGGDLVNEAPGVLDADFSPKGDALAIARFDSATSTFFLEYPVRHPLIQSGTPIDLVRVSPNGDRVAYSKVEGTEKWLWVVNRSGETHMLTGLGPGEAHRSLSWSSDGREIWFGATATKDRGMIQAITLDGKRRTVYWMPEAQLDDTGPSGEALVEMFRGWSGMRVRGASENRDSDLSWLGETVNVGLPAIGSQIFFTEQGSASGRVPGVYLRPRSGSPPVRLCDGSLIAVSPDGRWVSVYRAGPQPRYFLVPSYGGQEIPIEIPALENHTAAVIAWLPSGYLVWGNRPGAGKQHFDWNAGTGELKPVGPVSPSVGLASDDGAVLLASSPNGAVYEFPVRGGKPTQVQGLQPSDQLLRWAPGNGFVFAGSLSEGRRDFSIFKINVASGARTLWKRVDPDAPADSLAPAAITPDGNTYAYTYFRAQSELFLARGLK